MTDIADKLGIEIVDETLTEDGIITESKADQQKFIDKFGKEFFDLFWNNKQRLKNKNVNTDILYHVKHTSVEDMSKILDSISDEKRSAELDVEGQKIPAPTGNYDVVYKDDEYTVYHPKDYISSIHCANGGRWCTAGGYMISKGKVKVSQAKQYFNQYTSQGVNLYYFIRNNGERYALAVYSNGTNYEVYDGDDDRMDDIGEIPNIENIEIEGLDIKSMIGKGSSTACERCGERLHGDEVRYTPDDEPYCEECFFETCSYCDKCGESSWIDDTYATPDGWVLCTDCFDSYYCYCYDCGDIVSLDYAYQYDYNRYLCSDCLESGRYFICDECENIFDADDCNPIPNGGYVCDDCFEYSYFSCDGCGAVYETSECNLLDGDKLCDDCYSEANENDDD